MKVSYKWLMEYVDLSGYHAEDLAEKLTRGGIEVDVIEKRNKGVQQVVVGHVISAAQHPDADKLKVCRVDIGEQQPLQIVCGAHNVAAGQKVPVAVVGAVLPDNFKIKKAKLRGVESQGMICSAKELGLHDRLLPKEQQEGILVLPPEAEIGSSVIELLALDDEVLELDLTPNRADCLSMLGVAYEVSALIDREVKLPEVKIESSAAGIQATDHIHVKINAPQLCSHYAARLIEGITISPSPQWIQNRLIAAGIRPINNVVDITNLVMLEYGQPLHAFDVDHLTNGQIEVRLANQGEQLMTLDGVERQLDPSMLLITDGQRPVALAGVMGGADSEVKPNTKRILLESASFSGISVRKTSRKLGLRSEASQRFEKEADKEAVIPALERATALICQYAGGQAATGIAEDKVADEHKQRSIALSMQQVNAVLGTNITIEEARAIFDRLHFTYDQYKEGLLVHVPTRRGDITREVDLIEEIARLYGYDRIPTTLISGVTTPGSLSQSQRLRRGLRRLLADHGLHEVINYSLTHMKKIQQFPGREKDVHPIALAMPMSEERAVLRTSLIPHLLENAAYNLNRNAELIALFEIGRVFLTTESQLSSQPTEKTLLSILLSGERAAAHWSAAGQKVDFYDLKGVAEQIFDYLGMQNVSFTAEQAEGLHPGRAAKVSVQLDHERIDLGYAGQLHPNLQNELDLEETYILELDLQRMEQLATAMLTYRQLPRYPAIGRDIAIVVDEMIPASDIVAQVEKAAGPLLESVRIFDVYQGERLGSGKKSVALSLIYRHGERTLTDEEVSELHGQVVAQLEQQFSAHLRN